MNNLSLTLKSRRKELGLTLAQIADRMNVSEATVQRWESGNIKALRYDKVARLADVLNVHPTALMGWDETTSSSDIDASNAANLEPIELDRIPLVGRIACGQPILAEDHIEDYVDMPRSISADFALECHGDSMVCAGIQDGDIVYIRKQPTVENGQIAAVVIDGEEATLKRFYRDENKVILSAENPAYAPFIYVDDEINSIRIVGRAVGFTHRL